MNILIKQNKALYWGTSEWSAAQIVEAYRQAERNGLIPPVVEQPQYHMLWRDRFEREYDFIFRNFNYGSTIWSPLAGGILTGKYNSGDRTSVKDTRFSDPSNRMMTSIWNRYFDDKGTTLKKLQALGDLGKDVGYTQAQLALAWAAANQDVSTVIVGSSKISQMEENLKALELMNKWTPELEGRVEKILGNKPE